MGKQRMATGEERTTAPEPDAKTAIVDPAGLSFLQSGPVGAGGASGAIYRWLGIASDAKFPASVAAAIQDELQAKCNIYKRCAVIHVAAPDLREPRYDNHPDEVVEALAIAYRNVLTQFIESKKKCLRMLPISGGIFSGEHAEQLPELTARALKQAFAESLALNGNAKMLQSSELELCIYLEEELSRYEAAILAEFRGP